MGQGLEPQQSGSRVIVLIHHVLLALMAQGQLLASGFIIQPCSETFTGPLLTCPLKLWSLRFLAPGAGFVEDIFPTDQGVREGGRRGTEYTFIVYFVIILITLQ